MLSWAVSRAFRLRVCLFSNDGFQKSETTRVLCVRAFCGTGEKKQKFGPLTEAKTAHLFVYCVCGVVGAVRKMFGEKREKKRVLRSGRDTCIYVPM